MTPRWAVEIAVWIALALGSGGLVLHALGLVLALRKLRTPSPARAHEPAPPVSILKPLAGVDPDLARNLESFFTQDYPRFEIVFCCADADDPALVVARALIARHPAVDARIVTGGARRGENPKIANLAPAYAAARFEHVLISDSNVHADPDALARMLRHLEPGVGLVCSVIAASDPRGFGGELDALALHTFYTRGMHLALLGGRTATPGKAMLFEKRTLERAGGLAPLGRYFAEDYMLGRHIADVGARIAVTNEPVRQRVGELTFREYWARHARWTAMRRTLDPQLFAIELLFVNALVSGVFVAFAWHQLTRVAFSLALVVHLAAWCVADTVLHSRMGGRVRAHFVALWFVRELSAIGLWASAWQRRRVVWRGRPMQFSKKGYML